VWQTVLIAPTAVEWLAEASPNEVTVTASRGHGQGTLSFAARPMPSATPRARGRCEAIVDVCGMMDSSARPKTLCRPPAIGSSADPATPSSTSRIGSMPVTWRARAQ
jgi:hypothetical protein